MKRLLLCSIPVLVLAVGCQRNASIPASVIEESYSVSSHVVAVQEREMRIVQEINADDGSPGYVVRRISGKVIHVYKGGLSPGSEVVYDQWMEYDPELGKSNPERVLVFMNEDSVAHCLRVLESGRFPFSRHTGKALEAIAF